MKKSIEMLINEIDLEDNIDTKCIISDFEKKIKKDIHRNILLYGDNGGLDDYTLKNIDYVILYYIWKYINIHVKLDEILIIFYAFYKLEEFEFRSNIFGTDRICNIIYNSNISNLILNIVYIINEQLRT